MAIFSHIQHPLTFTFGILGNIISFMVFLAPVPTFYRIVKKKSTEGFQSVPYVVALFSSLIWIYYATLKTDATLLITINSFGCVIETIYIAIYIAYAPKKIMIQTIKMVVLLDFVGFWAIALGSHYLVQGQTRIQVLGWICLIISVSVFAAPLSIMTKVIRTKSVEFMPFGLSFFLALSAVMWFFYGLLQKDIYIALPNVIGFVLGVVQMVLYIIYKNYNKKPTDVEKKLSTSISTPEVHQVCNLPKCNENKETANAKDKSAKLQCAQEVRLDVTEEPSLVYTVQPTNALIMESTCSTSTAQPTSDQEEVGNKKTITEPVMGCTTMVKPITGLVCASSVHPSTIFEDHNKKKSMEAPNQVYLIESAA